MHSLISALRVTRLAFLCLMAVPAASANLGIEASDLEVDDGGRDAPTLPPIEFKLFKGPEPSGISIGISCIVDEKKSGCVVCFGTDGESYFLPGPAKPYINQGGFGIGISHDKVNGGAPYDAYKADPVYSNASC